MNDKNKKELQEVTEKLKKMDTRGLAIMNRDASTILLYQETMEQEEHSDKEAG